MRQTLVIGIVFAALHAGSAWSQPTWQKGCFRASLSPDQKDTSPQVIAACSEMIESGKFRGKRLGELYHTRARIYEIELEDYDRAIADFGEAMRHDPDGEALYRRAQVFGEHKRDFDAAISDLSELVRRSPRAPVYFTVRGEYHEKQGNLEKALADFQRALKIDKSWFTERHIERVRGKLLSGSGSSAQPAPAAAPAQGAAPRGWLGVQMFSVTAEMAAERGLKTTQGALVAALSAGGPAEAAGILAGDVITMVDGKAVIDGPDLAQRIASLAPATSVKVTVQRDDDERTYPVILGRLPEGVAAQAEPQPAEPSPRAKVDPVPSVKQLFEKRALLGVWAPDCGKPVSGQNKYLVVRPVDDNRVQIDSMDGPTSRSAVYVASSAVEPGPQEITLDVIGAGGEMRLPMRIEGDYLGVLQAWHHKCH